MPRPTATFILAISLALAASCKKPAPTCDSRCSPPRCTWSSDEQLCFQPCKSDDDCSDVEACVCDDPKKCLFTRAAQDISWSRSFRCVPLSGPPRSMRTIKQGPQLSSRDVWASWLQSLPELSSPQCDLLSAVTASCYEQTACDPLSRSPDGGVYFAQVLNPEKLPVFLPTGSCVRDRTYVGLSGVEPQAPDYVLSGSLARVGEKTVRFSGIYVKNAVPPPISIVFCGSCSLDLEERDGGLVAVGATDEDRTALKAELLTFLPKLRGCYDAPKVHCQGALRVTVKYSRVTEVSVDDGGQSEAALFDECIRPRVEQWGFSRRAPAVEIVAPLPCAD